MKFSSGGLVSAAAIAITMAAAAIAATTDTDFLVGHFRAGRIAITMTPDVAQKQYPAARVKRWEPYPRVAVIDIDPVSSQLSADSSQPALRLHLDKDQKQIWLISVGDKRYKTDRGIGAGATFGELRKAYPSLTVAQQEGEMDRDIVAQVKDEGLSFVLEFDENSWKKMGRHGPVSSIPDDKKIQSLAIVPPTK